MPKPTKQEAESVKKAQKDFNESYVHYRSKAGAKGYGQAPKRRKKPQYAAKPTAYNLTRQKAAKRMLSRSPGGR